MWTTKEKSKMCSSRSTKKSEANLASVRLTSTTRCSADESKSNATNQMRSKIKLVCYLMFCTAAGGEAQVERGIVCLNWLSLRRKYVKRLGVTLKTGWLALMWWVVATCRLKTKSQGRSAQRPSTRNRTSASTKRQPVAHQTTQASDKGKLHFFWKMKSQIVVRRQARKVVLRWTIQKFESLLSVRKKSSKPRSVLKKRSCMRKVWGSSRH